MKVKKKSQNINKFISFNNKTTYKELGICMYNVYLINSPFYLFIYLISIYNNLIQKCINIYVCLYLFYLYKNRFYIHSRKAIKFYPTENTQPINSYNIALYRIL